MYSRAIMQLGLTAMVVVFQLHATALSQAPAISANSLQDIARLNGLALQRFDALIFSSSFADQGEAGSDEFTQYTRLVVDLAAKHCLICSVGQRRLVANDPEGKPTIETTQLLASNLIEATVSRWREWPAGAVRRQHNDFFRALGDRETPLFNFVGVMPYPVRSGPYYTPDQKDSPHSDVEKFWVVIGSKWNTGKLALSPSGQAELKLAPLPHRGAGPAFSIVEEISFHPEHRLPVARRVVFETENERFPNVNEFVKWKEVDGIHVPEEILADSRGSSEWKGEDIAYERNTTVRVHWFSVNEKIDNRLFDEIVLDDPHRAQSLTDPVTTGATSLLER